MTRADSIQSGAFKLGRSIVTAVAFAAGLIVASGVQAGKFDRADSQAAGVFIVGLADRIAAVSESADTQSQTSRVLEAAQVLRESIDVKATGRFVLGPYRARTTAEQRAAFDALLNDLLLRNYLGQFAGEPGVQLEMLAARAINDSDTLVETRFQGADSKQITVWRVRNSENGFRIVDMAVDGMSLAITQRRTFTSRAGIQGIDEALASLDKDLNSEGPVLAAGKGLTGAHRSILASIFGSAQKGTVGLAVAGLK